MDDDVGGSLAGSGSESLLVGCLLRSQRGSGARVTMSLARG